MYRLCTKVCQRTFYKRYIFRSQQNYFRPNSDNKIIDHDFTYVEDSSFWEILSGSNVISASTSGSFGDDYAYGILDQTGVFTSNFFPSQYGEDGTLSENQVTASILPQGDLFPIFTQAAGDKEAIFTDVVVTNAGPLYHLPVQLDGEKGLPEYLYGSL